MWDDLTAEERSLLRPAPRRAALGPEGSLRVLTEFVFMVSVMDNVDDKDLFAIVLRDYLRGGKNTD